MKSIKLEAVVQKGKLYIVFEFGRTQASMWISPNGTIARRLKLKDEQKLDIWIDTID